MSLYGFFSYIGTINLQDTAVCKTLGGGGLTRVQLDHQRYHMPFCCLRLTGQTTVSQLVPLEASSSGSGAPPIGRAAASAPDRPQAAPEGGARVQVVAEGATRADDVSAAGQPVRRGKGGCEPLQPNCGAVARGMAAEGGGPEDGWLELLGMLKMLRADVPVSGTLQYTKGVAQARSS